MSRQLEIGRNPGEGSRPHAGDGQEVVRFGERPTVQPHLDDPSGHGGPHARNAIQVLFGGGVRVDPFAFDQGSRTPLSFVTAVLALIQENRQPRRIRNCGPSGRDRAPDALRRHPNEAEAQDQQGGVLESASFGRGHPPILRFGRGRNHGSLSGVTAGLPEEGVVRNHETTEKAELKLRGAGLEPDERLSIRVRELEADVGAGYGGLHSKHEASNQLVQERHALRSGRGGTAISIGRGL
jgi:hypothetical protein